MADKTTNTTTTTTTTCPQTFPWDQIPTPGTYVCNWSGHLLRIPNEAYNNLNTGTTINLIGTEPLYVTKLSDDPFLTINKARLTASNLDIPVNF